ncbi:putative glycosyl, partial [Golovinomyces cichoracearum]
MSKSEDAALLLPGTEEIEFKPINVYVDDNIYGRELHALWSLDFKDFNIIEYKKKTSQTKALRDFLRSCNVLLPRTGQSIAVELLKPRLTQWQPMPDDCLHEVKENFRPIYPITKQYAISSQNHPRPRYDPTVNSSSQSFINLMKIYNDESKYSGSPSDYFDTKFDIFCENCHTAGIAEEDRCKAFRIMLRDNALDQYRAILRENKDSTLEALRLSIKNTFEDQEHQQILFAKWNEISLQPVLNEQE